MGRGEPAGKLTPFRQIAARLAAGREPLAEPEDPMLGGLTVGAWFVVFWDTHAPNGMGAVVRIEWPEPGGYAEQATVTVEALALVREAVLEEAENERIRNSGTK